MCCRDESKHEVPGVRFVGCVRSPAEALILGCLHCDGIHCQSSYGVPNDSQGGIHDFVEAPFFEAVPDLEGQILDGSAHEHQLKMLRQSECSNRPFVSIHDYPFPRCAVAHNAQRPASEPYGTSKDGT